MSSFDNIIGYETVKTELIRTCDIFKNKEKYEKLRTKAPRGILLYGVPGVGKTLMATSLIEESGRKAFVCRKDLPDGEFLKAITKTFDDAVENAPSIVFLDDVDKFANGDPRHRNAEEYVAIQSCIDKYKDKDIFVLATANDIEKLPKSLCRAGRFDRIIELDTPSGEDAAAIVRKYLSDKPVDETVDAAFVARIMAGRSCAALETIINDAGIYAGYEGSDKITEDHFIRACMKLVFGEQQDDDSDDDDWSKFGNGTIERIVCHEAGHAVVGEILMPGSVTLTAVRTNPYSGITMYSGRTDTDSISMKRIKLIESLGGMAAMDQLYGNYGDGYSNDISKAFSIARELTEDDIVNGFGFYDTGYDESDVQKRDIESAAKCELEKAYRTAREIIAENRVFLLGIIDELKKKKIVTMNDIAGIKEKINKAA